MTTRRLLPVLLAASLALAAAPASASAEGAPETQSAPAAPGRMSLRLVKVGGKPPFVIAGERMYIRGKVTPYVAGQSVKVSFYRDHRRVQVQVAAVFPAGEGLATVSSRAAAAIRDVRHRATKDQTVLICSHGDVIKAILADALGMHLDQFQRIQADPCSLAVIRYTELRPFVVRLNDTGGGVDGLLPPTRKPRRGRKAAASSDAPVGGGAGS